MGQLDVTSSNWSTGAGAIDSYNSLITNIKNAHDEDKGVAAVEIGVAVFGVVADTVAFVLNPLSKLIAAGLGWLIEHVQFLKAPLDRLAGNPDGIKALADDLHKIGQDAAQRGHRHGQHACSPRCTSWQGKGRQPPQEPWATARTASTARATRWTSQATSSRPRWR